MKKFLFLASMPVIALCIFSFTKKEDTLKTRLEQLAGTYADAKPYAYGNAWGKRVFTFDKGKWTLNFTLSLDPEMKMPVFRFRTLGKYQLEKRSALVPNTYEAVFFEEKKFLTVLAEDPSLIKAFGFDACQLTPKIEKDISETGCLAWKPVATCPGDYDLLSLDKEGMLYFGERPTDNDMCSPDKRPTKLTPPV